MKQIFLTALCLLQLTRTTAQPSDLPGRTYENRKTYTIGVLYQHANSSALNQLLKQYGYGTMPSGFFGGCLQTSVHYHNRLGLFMEADLGGGNSEQPQPDKSAGFYYYRLEVGALYRVLQRKHITCDAQLGVGFSHYKLVLCDRLQDSVLARYLGNAADLKNVDGSQAMMDVGFLASFHHGPILSLGGGYIIPFEKNRWRIGEKEVSDGPTMTLGNYYLKACFGASFHRKITQLPDGPLD